MLGFFFSYPEPLGFNGFFSGFRSITILLLLVKELPTKKDSDKLSLIPSIWVRVFWLHCFIFLMNLSTGVIVVNSVLTGVSVGTRWVSLVVFALLGSILFYYVVD